MNKKLSLFLVFTLLIMAFSLVGCTNEENAAEENQSTNQEEAKTDEKEIEKQKFAIVAKTLIAEEKLKFIFEGYTPEGSEQSYLVAKGNYKTLDDVKNYLTAYYTEGMTNTLIENYIKMEEVAGKGQLPTLTLPEDYVALTSAVVPEVTIDGDNVQLQFSNEEKTVTYTYVKNENQWLIDSKTIQ